MPENTKVATAGFIERDDQLFWEESLRSELSDTGCIYICYCEAKRREQKHAIYMLVKVPTAKTDTFFWTTLWNTCGHSGTQVGPTRWQHTWPTMEEAIKAKLLAGWVVKRTLFDKIFKEIS